MKWSELCIHTTQEAVDPITNVLHESGSSGVVIEDPEDLQKDWPTDLGEVYELDPADYPVEGVYIKAYLPVNSFLGETVEEIKQGINNLLLHDIDLGHNTITISEVNEEEWATAWKKYYKPVKLTDHITITPTWEEYQPASDKELVIELDPGMAFGTGTHPTTVLCIKALEAVMPEKAEILDVGTGTGVLSIASAKLGARSVMAVDLDDVAVQSARLNVKLNKVHDRVTVKQNNLVDNFNESYDIIVANLLADIVIRLSDDAVNLLKSGGFFITSGIIYNKKDDVRTKLEQSGLSIVKTLEEDDWIAFVAQRN
ncbi:ribosomal protein L11 methyltransferase [Scopulibacillus darangshiensis]|uniref:Ribosomal protein L11 methyltransferase n=1 Tax=Scopulibacillus darangshiensis TaxID=442528 RepID=A0A4V2SNS4_9BACL|nr:50S ribosomal protein L11 methyltransferase [Scopulibacillus darangshiensis]TCP32336.1 ribosomal protein L11 methyltransferase [Scopulibacillus darangshiensis]